MRMRTLRADTRTPHLADADTVATKSANLSPVSGRFLSQGRFAGFLLAGVGAVGRCIASALAFATSLNARTPLVFVAAALIVLFVGGFSYRVVDEAGKSDALVRHSHRVLQNIEHLRLAAVSIESNSRAYIITGEPAYDEARRAVIAGMQRDLATLRERTIDNAAQQRRLPALERLLAERVQLSDTAIAVWRSAGFSAAVNATRAERNFALGAELDTVSRTMRNEELRLLALRADDSKRRVEQARMTVIFAALLAALIAAAAGWRVYRDSSQRRAAERDLRLSEDQYQALVQGVEDHAILMLDPTGVIVSWNTGAERMTGSRAEDVVGKNVSIFSLPEDRRSGAAANILRLATANGSHQVQGVRMRRNGTLFHVSSTFSAVRDAKGGLRGFSVISRDLSASAEAGAKYRGLLEAAPDAMVVVNQSGQIILLNVQAEKQFGYRRDELVGQPVTNIIPEGFAERLIADGVRSAADALAQQIGTGIELIALRKDGSEFPIEMMLSPLESPDGVLVTAAIRNISVRKAAEKVLAQMEGRYRGLLEAAPDAMVVVDQFGEIVLLNVQAEKQFGYRRDELLGQNVKNIIPQGFAERLVADGLRSAAEALAQQIGTGIELTALRKDGSKFPIELMLSPLDGPEGVLVTAAIRNISIRKNAERHIAQMEGRYRGLLEAAPDAMVVVNQAGEIVLLNLQAEKQFGYSRNELLGQKVTNIIPDGFAERLVADGLRSAEEALAQQIGMGIELIALRKDGSEFPIELMLSPLGGAEGILVTTAIRDITARKMAEAQLLQNVEELNRSNEELGQFAYIASHDLQEPLRMVASYTRLLSRRYKGRLDAQADEFIDFAEDGANRMQRLIQDLLAYSRIGTRGEERREISSELALGHALMNLRGAIEESGAIVTHDPLPLILGDETQLIQLFQNLVANAIKYQGPGVPKIHVSAVLDGAKKWVFSVNDNGLGIDAQYFEKIFGMFQRLHRREEFDGTGIGLAICKKIVERHGGAITVESQAGHGSTFRFVLTAA